MNAPRLNKVTSLTFILATGPEQSDLPRIVALARAAQRRRVATTLFAMHRGVLSLASDDERTTALHHANCDLIGCATSADQFGVDLAALGAAVGSQDDHARLVAGATRVLAFT